MELNQQYGIKQIVWNKTNSMELNKQNGIKPLTSMELNQQSERKTIDGTNQQEKNAVVR